MHNLADARPADHGSLVAALTGAGPRPLTLDRLRALGLIVEAVYPGDSRRWRMHYRGRTVDSGSAQLDLRDLEPLRLGHSAAYPDRTVTDVLSGVLIVAGLLGQHVIAVSDLLDAAAEGRLALLPRP